MNTYPKTLGVMWTESIASQWELRRVKDVAKIVNGFPFDSGKFDIDGLHSLVRIRDLSESSTETRYSGEWVEAAAIQSGDVLIGMDGDFNLAVWKGGEALLNQRVCCIRGDTSVISRYLAYALPRALHVTNELTYYTTVKHLSSQDIERITVPIPHEDKIDAIVQFLDDKSSRIDSLISEKERLVKTLKEYQYSYFSWIMTRGLDENVKTSPTIFPEIGEVPAHWKVTPLKFLGEIRSGVAKGKDHGDKDTVMLPYLRVANVQDGYVDLNEVYDIEVSSSDAARYLLRKGDVLMNEGGDNDKLGRGAVWQGQIEPCIHQNHVFAVRLKNPELADWVSCFTSTDPARTYFFLRSKQSTNLASINQSNVRELPIPMPPDDERKAIMAELKRITKSTNELIEHAIEHISRLREYRSSLISAAVTGQIDVSNYKVAA